MPKAVPIVAAAAMSGGAALAAGAVMGTLTAASAMSVFLSAATPTLILGGLSYVLNKPKNTSINDERGIKDTVRGTIETRKIVYGTAKVGGILVFPGTKGTKNQYLYLSVVLCEAVDSIDEVYFNNRQVYPDLYQGYGGEVGVIFISYKYTPAPVINTDVEGSTVVEPESTDIINGGKIYIYYNDLNGVRHTKIYTGTIKEVYNLIYADIQSGDITDFSVSICEKTRHSNIYNGPELSEEDFASLYSIKITAAYPTTGLDIMTLPPEGGGEIKFGYSLSNEENTKLVQIERKPEGGLANLLAANFPEWNDGEHLLQGCAHITAKLTYESDRKAWDTGIPSISAVVKGKRVYHLYKDGEDYKLSGYRQFSQNWADCILDYLIYHSGLGLTLNDFNLENWYNAKVICESNGFYVNGVIDTADTPRKIIEDLCTSCAGFIVFSLSGVKAFPGVYTSSAESTPNLLLDISYLAGKIEYSTTTPTKDFFNTVIGTYISSEGESSLSNNAQYQPATFEKVTHITTGEEITKDIQFPFVITESLARKLADIYLLKSQNNKKLTIECNLKALVFEPGDVISCTIPFVPGIDEKEFMVMESTFNQNGNGVSIVLIEENDNYHSIIETSTKTHIALPLQDSAIKPSELTNVQAREVIFNDNKKTKGIQIDFDPLVTDISHYAISVSDGTDTQILNTTTPKNTYRLRNVRHNRNYQVRVAGVNTRGIKGPESVVSIRTNYAADPDLPTGLTVTPGYFLNHISVEYPETADEDIAAILYCSPNTNDRENATRIGTLHYPDTIFNHTNLTNISYFYWCRFFDNSINKYSGWFPVSSTAGIESVPLEIQGGEGGGLNYWSAFFDGPSITGVERRYFEENKTITLLSAWCSFTSEQDIVLTVKKNDVSIGIITIPSNTYYVESDTLSISCLKNTYLTIDLSNPGGAKYIGIRIHF